MAIQDKKIPKPSDIKSSPTSFSEEELKEYRQKVQNLKGENPNNSELKDLDTKTQKAQEDISESLKEEKKTSVFICKNYG